MEEFCNCSRSPPGRGDFPVAAVHQNAGDLLAHARILANCGYSGSLARILANCGYSDSLARILANCGYSDSLTRVLVNCGYSDSRPALWRDAATTSHSVYEDKFVGHQ